MALEEKEDYKQLIVPSARRHSYFNLVDAWLGPVLPYGIPYGIPYGRPIGSPMSGLWAPMVHAFSSNVATSYGYTSTQSTMNGSLYYTSSTTELLPL